MVDNAPVRRSDLISAEMHEELMLYNAEERKVHILNSTAQLVWTLCDGQHTLEDMVGALRATYAIPEDRDVLADVQATLADFASKNLLVTESDGQGAG